MVPVGTPQLALGELFADQRQAPVTASAMEKHVMSYGFMARRACVKAASSAVTDAHSQSPVSGESMRGRRRGVTKLVRKCQSEVVSKHEEQHRGSSKRALKCHSNVKTSVANADCRYTDMLLKRVSRRSGAS
ncbi:unnamed protein product [Nippostrongylus brasiliensis]|uniref:Uncharacterized protein n=1 Tax=Nippostrongylus brasiliensis TaxID=27835 RepID=A0A0N4YMY8_NIPBR|nr:unnamed protein product [Nippostrongylus brasiliensis]